MLPLNCHTFPEPLLSKPASLSLPAAQSAAASAPAPGPAPAVFRLAASLTLPAFFFLYRQALALFFGLIVIFQFSKYFYFSSFFASGFFSSLLASFLSFFSAFASSFFFSSFFVSLFSSFFTAVFSSFSSSFFSGFEPLAILVAILSKNDFPFPVIILPLCTPFCACFTKPAFSSCCRIFLIMFPEPL